MYIERNRKKKRTRKREKERKSRVRSTSHATCYQRAPRPSTYLDRPNINFTIIATSSQIIAIWTPNKKCDRVRVACECMNWLPSLSIPNDGCFIFGCGSKKLAIGRKLNVPNLIRVTCAYFLAVKGKFSFGASMISQQCPIHLCFAVIETVAFLIAHRLVNERF